MSKRVKEILDGVRAIREGGGFGIYAGKVP